MLFDYSDPFNAAFPAAAIAAGGVLRIIWLRSPREAALCMALAFVEQPWRMN